MVAVQSDGPTTATHPDAPAELALEDRMTMEPVLADVESPATM
jgi:hypothetical protein